MSVAVITGAASGMGRAVVNFASIDAFVPSPGQLLYCASKGRAGYVTGETLTAAGGSAFR